MSNELPAVFVQEASLQSFALEVFGRTLLLAL